MFDLSNISQSPGPREVRWVWEYIGPPEDAPVERYMVEETLGPYERKLLLLNKGKEVLNLVTGDDPAIIVVEAPKQAA